MNANNRNTGSSVNSLPRRLTIFGIYGIFGSGLVFATSCASVAPILEPILKPILEGETQGPDPESGPEPGANRGGPGPGIGNCPVFPAADIWNTRIDRAPVHSRSNAYVNSIGANTRFHPDFGSGTWQGAPIGIPYQIVDNSTPMRSVRFQYASESDPGPYPIPNNPLIEGGPDSDGDRHIIAIRPSDCTLFELFAAYPEQGGRAWRAGSGAKFDLRSHQLRPDTWTSADAAGLPIFPGLVRYDEVAAGEIKHAIRFTAVHTRRAYVWPARHYASSKTDKNIPPLGQRFRLKRSFDVSGYSPEVKVILIAMQRYGIILADNGSNWFVSGAPDERWNNSTLRELKRLTGKDFEAVDVSGYQVRPDSGQARIP
ncbi:MAG: hypothetical protein NXI24_14375 [bacterium]|nr:hypothetical protein [bacterium]